MTDFSNFADYRLKHLERKGKIFIHKIDRRVDDSLKFIDGEYSRKQVLTDSIDFIENHLTDGVKADFDNLERVGFYPITETQLELDHAIKHALIGSYKSAFSDLRRALELMLVSIYLTSEFATMEKAKDWIIAQSDTPFFSSMVSDLKKKGRFNKIDSEENWSVNLKYLYHSISDFTHNKGEIRGYRTLNNANFFYNGTSAPSIRLSTLESFCDYFIKTVSEIITMLALYNPIVLIGLPLDIKFGINPPISGFYYDHQAEAVHKLLPDNYRSFFKNLMAEDSEVISIAEWVNTMPDLTEEDFLKQVKQQQELFEKFERKSDELF